MVRQGIKRKDGDKILGMEQMDVFWREVNVSAADRVALMQTVHGHHI